jgi:tetratricopeptide (TPR) repeat protein
MKKYFFLLFFSCITVFAFSQEKPKPAKQPAKTTTTKQSSQVNMDKMLEDAMKDQGMSKEELEEMKKTMSQMKPLIDEMKQASNGSASNEILLKIPVKQIKILSSIPNLSYESQLNAYEKNLLEEAKKNISREITSETDKYFSKFSSDEKMLEQIGIILLLNKNVKAAVYASLKAVAAKPGNGLIQSNLAFMLHQTGYPQKAIPIIKYLLQKYKSAELNNNLAHCYLSLGDRENATKYFQFALHINPQISESHCGLGIIDAEEGRIPEATSHIKESLKNGYSVTADELAKKYKMKLTYTEMKVKAPEYFNPQKYKPVQAASDMTEIPIRLAERDAARERYRNAYKISSEFNAKYGKTLNEANIGNIYKQHIGYTGISAFSRKAFFMVRLVNDELHQYLLKEMDIVPFREQHNSIRKEFDAALGRVGNSHFDNEAERCEARVKVLNKYLKDSKENFDNYERKALHKIYDLVNESLYWQTFLLNGKAYTSYFNDEVREFYSYLQKFDELQNLYPMPEWIYKNCANYKEELKRISLEQIEENKECPINTKLVFGEAASVKYNCKGYELEGGELLKLSFEKDEGSGEYTIAFGLGADISTPVLSLGAKGMTYFKFDKSLVPIDMGMKGEANIEAQLVFLNAEEKVTGTMGISNASLTFTDRNNEYQIFKADATQEKSIQTILDTKE